MRDYSKSKHADIITTYLEQYGELLSNSKIAKIILKENPSIDATKHTLRVVIGAIRNANTEVDSTGVAEACAEMGVNPNDAPMLWLKNKDASIRVTNPAYKKQDQNQFFEELVASFAEYKLDYPTINREPNPDGHLLVVDIADLHINKYAEAHLTGADYNSKIAVERALEGTRGIINKASGFNVDKILFVIGNDVLNTDNLNKQTTRGTPQDTDLNWFTAFNIAKDCYVKCIEMCMQVADVDVLHCPSNHDFMSGTFLAATIEAWFRESKNVKVDPSPKYRKYYQYFSNMLELEHGDKGKMLNLPLTMASEEPQMWADTKFRYGYLHHVHHQDKTQFKSSKDYSGANITYLRSPSSADLWHSDNQYLNTVAIEGFVHSKEEGRVAHLTHYF